MPDQYTVLCAQCGLPFPSPRRKSKYCSRACAIQSRRSEVAEVLAARTDRGVEHGRCWRFTGGLDRDGYGQISISGRLVRAHRLAYELAYGPIPPGLWVLHHCDNRWCVNPACLFLGTVADNNADMCAKGRNVSPGGMRNGAYTKPERRPTGDRSGARLHPQMYRGERNANAKLTEAQVREIRAALDQGEARKALVTRYGVSAATVDQIATGRAWRHLTMRGGSTDV